MSQMKQISFKFGNSESVSFPQQQCCCSNAVDSVLPSTNAK